MLLTENQINELKNLISSFDLKEVKKWRRFRVVASTEDSDRAWEIIKANWWDYKNFMKIISWSLRWRNGKNCFCLIYS